MAEYLVMADDHWIRKVPPEQRATWSPDMWARFHASYEKGDIIAVYDDKALTTIAHNKFKGVKVPGEAVDKARESLYEADTDIGTPVMKRRFNVDLDTLVPTEKQIETVTAAAFTSAMADKKALMESEA